MLSNEALTIIGVMITLFGIGFTLMLWAINRTDTDVNKLSSRMDGHASRIDQLYSMFVDLIKQNK